MITIPLIVCAVGLAIWLIFSASKTSEPVIAEAGKWAYIIGLFFVVAGYAGKAML